jgi:hypothetical protein
MTQNKMKDETSRIGVRLTKKSKRENQEKKEESGDFSSIDLYEADMIVKKR